MRIAVGVGLAAAMGRGEDGAEASASGVGVRPVKVCDARTYGAKADGPPRTPRRSRRRWRTARARAGELCG